MKLMSKIEVEKEIEKEIERRGNKIGLLELPKKKPKNFVFGITFLTFF